MAKLLTRRISHCWQCTHVRLAAPRLSGGPGVWKCTRMEDRCVERRGNGIPDWCPLPSPPEEATDGNG